MKCAKYCTRPRNLCTSLRFLGMCHSRMHAILSASACRPLSSIMWPRQSILLEYKLHFAVSTKRQVLQSFWSTYLKLRSWSSRVKLNMNRSLRYICTQMPIPSRKMTVMSHWNDPGTLQSPCCITLLSCVPYTVANAVLCTSSGSMHTCSYALDKLIFKRYFACTTSIRICS